jgi:hypothetical protein
MISLLIKGQVFEFPRREFLELVQRTLENELTALEAAGRFFSLPGDVDIYYHIGALGMRLYKVSNDKRV